jgi:predicted RNA binding protein YcfA (HicA-like mRNA interferase family)
MSSLPVVSGTDCAKALEKAGFYLRRREGSHMILRRDSPFAQTTVPDHQSKASTRDLALPPLPRHPDDFFKANPWKDRVANA